MSNIRYQTLRNLIFGLVANRLIRAGFCINPAFWIAYLFINLKIRNLYSAFGRNTQNGMVVKICPMFLRQCLNRGNELLLPSPSHRSCALTSQRIRRSRTGRWSRPEGSIVGLSGFGNIAIKVILCPVINPALSLGFSQQSVLRC
jgi:hypothetical protein